VLSESAKAGVKADNVEPLAYDTLGAAKVLGIGRSTLFVEIAEGRLKARKAGRRTVISREDCLAWLASLPVQQGARAA
jgi:excisionase family DNA binding protein